ncbi:MAG: CUB domain-containing protein, partial [Flavobacteriales bacterium]|nr:CUB domain-containing protein [Flavobacteriales bacterium]
GITPTAIAQEQIGASNDDAFDYSDGGNVPTAINCRLGYRSGAGFLDCTTGLRFQTVPLPQGATITTATLSVRAYDAVSPTINTKISADDVDNSIDFSATKPSGRTKTTSQVDWDVSVAWSTGTYYNSPEIKTVIQEIVNRGSWASNNSLSIIVANDGGTDNRNMSTYNENTAYGARFNASYVTQGTATSSIVDYASFVGATAWNQVVWNDTETGSDIKYKIFYGSAPIIVPDGALAGNSAGFDTSPIDISGLNTGTYDKLTIVGYLNYTTASPSINDWEITVSLGDQDSDADAPTTQVAAGTIPSTATGAGTAVDVFKFKIKDLATADTKLTKVTNIRIQPGASNTADWTDHIQGVTLDYNGVPVTIGAATITDTYIDIPITSPNLDVANGEITKEATIAVYLSTSNIIDNLIFDCKITAASHGWTNGSNSSAFAANFGTDIVSNQFTITVAAIKLVFEASKPPTLVPLNQTFAVTVNATDANGNADADEGSSVTLALNTGTGTLASNSNLTQTLAGGTYAWTDVYYNTVEGCFKIEAQSGTLTNIISPCIQCVDRPGAFSLSAPLLIASCPANVAVTWGASSGSTSFDLYYCTGTNCDPTLSSTLFTGVTSSYTFNASAYNNDTIRFQVKAINSAGETWSTNVGEHYVWLSNGGWGGGTSTDWNNAANWCGSVPTCSDSIVIQSNAPNQPVLTATGNAGDITIGAGASLGLGTFTMNVYGDFTNAGTVNSGTGTVKFTSTGCGGGSNYSMTNTTQSVATGDAYHDDNGSASNYSTADYTQTLTPATAGKKVSITFSVFDVEFHATCGFDYLKIYDGPNVASPLLGTFCGATNPGTFTSTDAGGALTFKFFADGATEAPGWVGAITLLPSAGQTIDLGTSALNDFTVEATTVTVINNTLDVNGNLAITNGGTLNGGSQTIEVAGNWNNTGTFSASTSTVIFDGTGTSTVTRLSSASATVLSEGFESGTSGWTLGMLSGSTDWRRQAGGNTGSFDCGTYDLVGATAHGYYKPGNTSKNGYIDMSRSIDLRDYSSATLDFYWKCSGSGAFGYSGMVKMNGVDIITSNADAQLFSQSTFTAEPQISLNSYANSIATLSFRFNLVYQGSSGSNPGFTIDDILIKGITDKETFYNVQFNKTGGSRVDLASKMDATNDLTIGTGSTLDANGFRIRSKGNFTNNGTFTHGNGEVIFSGTTAQIINGSSNTIFYDFSKSSTVDLTLGDATVGTTIEVSNNLSWTDNDDKIIIGNGQSTIFKINDDIYIKGGCTLETKNNCTALISGNYTNFGTYTYNQGKIEFYGATPSNVLREPALSIFSEDFESGTTGWTLGSSAGNS